MCARAAVCGGGDTRAAAGERGRGRWSGGRSDRPPFCAKEIVSLCSNSLDFHCVGTPEGAFQTGYPPARARGLARRGASPHSARHARGRSEPRAVLDAHRRGRSRLRRDTPPRRRRPRRAPPPSKPPRVLREEARLRAEAEALLARMSSEATRAKTLAAATATAAASTRTIPAPKTPPRGVTSPRRGGVETPHAPTRLATRNAPTLAGARSANPARRTPSRPRARPATRASSASRARRSNARDIASRTRRRRASRPTRLVAVATTPSPPPPPREPVASPRTPRRTPRDASRRPPRRPSRA